MSNKSATYHTLVEMKEERAQMFFLHQTREACILFLHRHFSFIFVPLSERSSETPRNEKEW